MANDKEVMILHSKLGKAWADFLSLKLGQDDTPVPNAVYNVDEESEEIYNLKLVPLTVVIATFDLIENKQDLSCIARAIAAEKKVVGIFFSKDDIDSESSFPDFDQWISIYSEEPDEILEKITEVYESLNTSIDPENGTTEPNTPIDPNPTKENTPTSETKENKSKRSNSLLPGIKQKRFQIYPKKIRGMEKFVIILQEPTDEINLTLRLENTASSEKKNAKGIRKSPYNFAFLMPEFSADGEIRVLNKSIVALEKIQYLTPEGTVLDILQTFTLDGLFKSLQVGNIEALDFKLADMTRRFACQKVLLFEENPTQDASANIEFPSLLHFAAKNNLVLFAEALLLCPGSRSAFNIENEDGKTPKGIAEDRNNKALIRLFEEYESEPESLYLAMTPFKDIEEVKMTLTTFTSLLKNSEYDYILPGGKDLKQILLHQQAHPYAESEWFLTSPNTVCRDSSHSPYETILSPDQGKGHYEQVLAPNVERPPYAEIDTETKRRVVVSNDPPPPIPKREKPTKVIEAIKEEHEGEQKPDSDTPPPIVPRTKGLSDKPVPSPKPRTSNNSNMSYKEKSKEPPPPLPPNRV